MRKIIIGSTGYIGETFSKFLTQNGENTISCSRANSDIAFDLEENDFSELEANLIDGDFVYFFAGISSPDYCEKFPEHSKKVNLTNTINLIEKILAKNCKVLFASTDAVYSNSTIEVDEDSEQSPIGNYGFYKSEVEKNFIEDPNFSVARFSYVFGSDKFSNYLLRNQLEKKEIFNGFKRRAVSIDDVLLGLNNYNWDLKAINFSGPDLISRMEIAEMYKKNIYHDLILDLMEPPDSFWDCRAKEINMGSKHFKSVLSKEPQKIEDVIKKL
tara:strand:- start:3248 stop:4060 length:813 start_codon:yes stop_codon:yes gene_type:complete